MTIPLQGTSLIGYSRGAQSNSLGLATNPATCEDFGTEYFSATRTEVESAARLAGQAFPVFEVCPSIVHGGPFPATSDGRSTSVGTPAIDRFCRQVAGQDFPDAALPEALREVNPLEIWRLVDGERTR